MSMLNIRIDESTKNTLQEVAKFKGQTLSKLVLHAINEMLENEFDQQLAEELLTQRTDNEKNYPIENLLSKYEIKDI